MKTILKMVGVHFTPYECLLVIGPGNVEVDKVTRGALLPTYITLTIE
jgi:hypothetical protein